MVELSTWKDCMTRLRATRASPPGLAATDENRKETYGAALQQFDELMLAASTVSPVSRPLPLYYAVLQAGKAIAAALAPGDWSKIGHGHGLGEDRDIPPSGHDTDAVWPGRGDDGFGQQGGG
jgi:hypothetical protein